MLQQTQAARAGSAFEAFVERFPTVRALARASRADVIRAWGSLGYNRRAVALARAARIVVERHGGRVPEDPKTLETLPGIGPYTAAAIASLAFRAPVPALDVNVARVVARARIGRDGVGREEVARAAAAWIDARDPGAWNQALMDLGREVCRPAPKCDQCPLRGGCRFRRAGTAPGGRTRTQPAFEGSFRQVRGAVVRTLRNVASASVAAIVDETAEPRDRVVLAIRALAADGVVSAGPAALAGRPAGRVRLPT